MNKTCVIMWPKTAHNYKPTGWREVWSERCKMHSGAGAGNGYYKTCRNEKNYRTNISILPANQFPKMPQEHGRLWTDIFKGAGPHWYEREIRRNIIYTNTRRDTTCLCSPVIYRQVTLLLYRNSSVLTFRYKQRLFGWVLSKKAYM